MVTEVNLLLYQAAVKEIHTDLCLVPGHTGIVGNGNADSSMKVQQPVLIDEHR